MFAVLDKDLSEIRLSSERPGLQVLSHMFRVCPASYHSSWAPKRCRAGCAAYYALQPVFRGGYDGCPKDVSSQEAWGVIHSQLMLSVMDLPMVWLETGA